MDGGPPLCINTLFTATQCRRSFPPYYVEILRAKSKQNPPEKSYDYYPLLTIDI